MKFSCPSRFWILRAMHTHSLYFIKKDKKAWYFGVYKHLQFVWHTNRLTDKHDNYKTQAKPGLLDKKGHNYLIDYLVSPSLTKYKVLIPKQCEKDGWFFYSRLKFRFWLIFYSNMAKSYCPMLIPLCLKILFTKSNQIKNKYDQTLFNFVLEISSSGDECQANRLLPEIYL